MGCDADWRRLMALQHSVVVMLFVRIHLLRAHAFALDVLDGTYGVRCRPEAFNVTWT